MEIENNYGKESLTACVMTTNFKSNKKLNEVSRGWTKASRQMPAEIERYSK